MPEGTLKALSRYNEIGEILSGDGGDCEEILSEFTRAGIDLEALAQKLQEDGAKSFVKSWNELIAVITSKSKTL